MASETVTVHIIGQAHLDPIWLWGWQAGLDEVLATCRTACDLLDEYEEFIFTRGEAWCYQQVELVDPALFARIRRHVEAGRWEIVGGWWIQPDCNFPSGIGFERQIAVGKRYLQEKFGCFPEVGYNVDSFGHAATLPGIMQAAGQRYYVMMRPQEHEMTISSRVFRWRGYADGPEVTTFRIAGSYNTWVTPDEWHIRRSLQDLPEGITDTMCFIGIGDHGGGPTEEAIKWVIEHANAFDGCRLVFSSPSRYFRAIADKIDTLPVVTGELQHHAIGCYSVQREIKTRLRKAEQRMYQAEMMHEQLDQGNLHVDDCFNAAWQRVAFNQFHDILGGTSIPSAYPQAYDQLGYASNIADDYLQHTLRRKMNELPDDPRQRIVLFNASDSAYSGYAEIEPWTQWQPWRQEDQLVDEDGQSIPFQVLAPESIHGTIPRLLFRTEIAPGQLRVIKVGRTDSPVIPEAQVHVTGDTISNYQGVSLSLLGTGGMSFPGLPLLPLPRLELIEDRSDNWSHGIDRYPEGPVVSANWNTPCLMHQGSYMASLLQLGQVGNSPLQAEWRVYAGEPSIELRLRVHWMDRLQLLKITLLLPGAPSCRLDGIPGGSLQRNNDGKERPVQNWSLFDCEQDKRLGVVCPDVFAIDATPVRARFTLLRSALMTHHEPNLGMVPNAVVSDQGVHEFRFRFFGGVRVDEYLLDQQALMWERPLITADLTRGMPRKY